MANCYPPGSKVEIVGCQYDGDILIGSAYELAITTRNSEDFPVGVYRWDEITIRDTEPINVGDPDNDPQVGSLGPDVDELLSLAQAVRGLSDYFPAQGKRLRDDTQARDLYLRLAGELRARCEAAWKPRPLLIPSH